MLLATLSPSEVEAHSDQVEDGGVKILKLRWWMLLLDDRRWR